LEFALCGIILTPASEMNSLNEFGCTLTHRMKTFPIAKPGLVRVAAKGIVRYFVASLFLGKTKEKL
jgi:hypothetical protein